MDKTSSTNIYPPDRLCLRCSMRTPLPVDFLQPFNAGLKMKGFAAYAVLTGDRKTLVVFANDNSQKTLEAIGEWFANIGWRDR